MFKVEEYKRLATANAKKKVTDLKVGDFVWVYGSHMKNDTGRLSAEIYYLSEKCYQCLGIIAGIEYKKDEEIMTGDFRCNMKEETVLTMCPRERILMMSVGVTRGSVS